MKIYLYEKDSDDKKADFTSLSKWTVHPLNKS